MSFEKTILVPVDTVEDIDCAVDLVECGVADSSIMLLSEDAEHETIRCPYANQDGVYELTDEEAVLYQIVEGSGRIHGYRVMVDGECVSCNRGYSSNV